MTTANLIEISCILNEFHKYFDPELKKILLKYPASVIATVLHVCLTAKSWPYSCRSTHVISAIWNPSTFAISASIWKESFPIGSLTTASWSVRHWFVSLAAVPPNMRTWQVHRHIHHRFHTSCVMPHQAWETASDEEWMDSQREVHNGLVLRL